jgi:hypothetical protein
MFWRIVGAVLSLTFFVAAFSIWGDPTCRSVTMRGGRFGIAYTCLGDSSGTSANGFAWFLFFVGFVLLVFNLWPYIRVWFNETQSKHQDYLADIEEKSALQGKSSKTVPSQAGGHYNESEEFMRPTNCRNCDKKLNKTSKFCQNCGQEVTGVNRTTSAKELESDSFQCTGGSKSKTSSNSSGGAGFNSIATFGLIGLILIIVVVALSMSSQNPQVASTPTPTETPETYSMSEVLAAAGEGFFYVNDGFAMKWDDSEGSCTGLTSCVWVKVYSMEECNQLSFSLTFTDDAKNVVGKDYQTGGFGLAAGETGRYELKWLTGAELVQMDDITCMWRN